MAKKNGFMKDVPLPVKLSLVACAVVTALAGVYLFSAPSGNRMLVSENTGKVDIAVVPTIKNGDENEVVSEVITEVYQDAEEKKLEEAMTGQSSYLDELKLANDTKVAEKLIEREADIVQQAHIDDKLGMDSVVVTQRKKNQIKKDRERLVEVNDEPQPYFAPVATIPLFDESAFLLEETNRKSNFLKNRQAAVSTVLSSNMAKGGGSVTTRFEPTANGNGSGSNWNSGGSDHKARGTMSEFLTDGQRMKNTVEQGKQHQVSKLEEYRARNNPKGSQPSSSSSTASQPQHNGVIDTAINDLANPMGFTDQSSMKFITPGTIYYSVLEIGVNTDEVSHVRALIVQEGPLKGGILLGLPERRGQKAIIAFNKLALHGKEYGIDAVALDLETMRTGIADTVDNHTFERYTKLMAAAFISGYADSLSGGTTKTYSDGTTETIIERLPDTDDQIAYAIGKAGDKLVPIFEREFDRVPTVEIDANREIAIMLLSGLQIME